MDTRRPDRFGPPAAAVALLAVAAAAAVFAAPQARWSSEPEPADALEPLPSAPTGPPAPPSKPVDVDATVPDWLATAMIGLGVVVAAVIVAILLWRIGLTAVRTARARRHPAGTTVVDEPVRIGRTQAVAAAVAAGLADLADLDADPRRAVIACWVRLEAVAAAVGTARHAGDTATDLVSRLLDDHRVSAAVLDGLAAVYRQARYATHVIDEEMRAAAVGALERLRGELLAPAGAVAEGVVPAVAVPAGAVPAVGEAP